MSEARINVATGFNGGVSVSLRADSATELLALQDELRAAAAKDTALAKAVKDLIGSDSPFVDAVNTVQNAFPGTTTVSTVGQPLPQPVAQPQPTAAVSTPPGLAYPGNCQHGVRVYSDKPARGKVWKRWECAIPWSRDAQGRCKPVDA